MNRPTSIFFWIVTGWLFPAFLIKEIKGKENFSKKRNYILASNHLSHLDWLIGCYLCVPRKYTFIGQVDKITGIIGFGRDLMYRAGETIRVDRNDKGSRSKALDKAIEFLKKGYNLFIYPEGTRSRDGKLHEFKPGVAKLYLETGVPILPVAMIGTYELMPPGGKLNLKKNVRVIIGRPLEFPEMLKATANLDRQSAEYYQICSHIAKAVEDQVRKLLQDNE